jgi:hypothetical protein
MSTRLSCEALAKQQAATKFQAACCFRKVKWPACDFTHPFAAIGSISLPQVHQTAKYFDISKLSAK